MRDKIVVITGGGSGLGFELARQYAGKGAQVLLLGRHLDKLTTACDRIRAVGGSAEAFACDIQNEEEVIKVYERIKSTYKAVDLLVNNAGIGAFGPLESLEPASIHAMLSVNVLGTITMTRVFKPIVREQMLFIISTAGRRGKVNESVYCASKFAVRGFVESLQKEWTDIAVTAVYMGGMATPFWAKSTHIADPSRLKAPEAVAAYIVATNTGQPELYVE